MIASFRTGAWKGDLPVVARAGAGRAIAGRPVDYAIHPARSKHARRARSRSICRPEAAASITQQQAAVQAVAPAWHQQQPQQQPPRPGTTLLGFWVPIALVFCLSLVSLVGALIAAFFYLRPVLKAAERAALAAEQAALQMDVAAKEMEKAALVLSNDLPVTLLEMEKTSKEFEALGRNLNQLTKILVRQPADAVTEAVVMTTSNLQESTRSRLQKVVDDVSTLTNARGWIAKWRSRSAAAAGANSEEGALDTPPDSLPPNPRFAPEDSSPRSLWRISTPWERSKGAEAAGIGEAGGEAEGPAQRAQQAQQQTQAQAPRPAEAAGGWEGAKMGQHPPASQAPSISERKSAAQAVRMVKAAVVAQLKGRDGGGSEEERAAAAAVLSALDRAQKAAEEAASATGALDAALDRAEAKGAFGPSKENGKR